MLGITLNHASKQIPKIWQAFGSMNIGQSFLGSFIKNASHKYGVYLRVKNCACNWRSENKESSTELDPNLVTPEISLNECMVIMVSGKLTKCVLKPRHLLDAAPFISNSQLITICSRSRFHLHWQCLPFKIHTHLLVFTERRLPNACCTVNRLKVPVISVVHHRTVAQWLPCIECLDLMCWFTFSNRGMI